MESSKSNPNNNQNQEKVKDWTDIHEGFYKENYRGSGKTYQQYWEQANITYEQAKLWIKVGFEPKELYKVKQWINCEFTPTETKTWLDKGLRKDDDWHFASWLRNNNQTITNNLKQLRGDVNYNHYWLTKHYPNQNVKELDISHKYLKGELNLSNYSQLEKLDCYKNNLTTITYPEQLVYLTELNIWGNNFLQQEPTFLTKMPNLEVLSMGGKNNYFTNLDSYLKYCPKLKKLYAWNSNLTGGSLTIQDLPVLEEVNLLGNNLTNLQLLNCPNLTVIYCFDNKLNNLPCYYWLDLQSLDCSHNQLTHLDLSQNINLTQLDCSNCQLASLNVENCSNLAELKCQNNKLVNLNLTKNLALTTLLANDNNLIEIEFPTDLNKFNLTRINITNNQGLNYLAIDKKFLKILPKLEPKKAIVKLHHLDEQARERKWEQILAENDDEEIKNLKWEKEEGWENSWNQVINKVKKDIKGEIQAPIYFSTWWNPNCALIVNKVMKYAIRLVIYELEQTQNYYNYNKEFIKVIRFPSSNHLVGYKSMDRVQEKIAWLKEKLNSDNPILALEGNNFSPTEIMEINRIYDTDYLNPTDLVWRNMKGLLGTYHVAVYLGNEKVAHIGSSKFVKSIGFNPSNPSGEKALLGARVDHWEDFKLNADKMFVYHPIIPFKKPELIQEQLTKAVLAEYGQAEYNLFGNNCEHFATMIVCGVPFSTQSDKIKMLIKDWDLKKEIEKSNKKFEEMTTSETYKREQHRTEVNQQITNLKNKTELTETEQEQLTNLETELQTIQATIQKQIEWEEIVHKQTDIPGTIVKVIPYKENQIFVINKLVLFAVRKFEYNLETKQLKELERYAKNKLGYATFEEAEDKVNRLLNNESDTDSLQTISQVSLITQIEIPPK